MSFNLLIVDDSSSMRAIIKKAIRISGFTLGECCEAPDGQKALEVLRSNWVDLVLTDINMPKMNGLELLRAMKEDELLRSIPVVVITTEGSEKRMKECCELGAKGYVKKPFKPEDIKKTLNRVMGEDEDGKEGYEEALEGSDF